MEFARRKIAQQIALAPEPIPGIAIGKDKTNIWLWEYSVAGDDIHCRPVACLGWLKNRGFYLASIPAVRCLCFDWDTCDPLDGWDPCVGLMRCRFQLHKPVESRRIVIEIRPVLALYGCAVDLCFCFAGICAVGADYATLTEEN